MRFAYIDSNGNEVPIPSVDALALRIELGAITDQTQLYDAQADQWGPADTHEIFHTLSRTAGGDDGFVAPPPAAPAPVPPPSVPAPEEALPVEEADSEDAGPTLADSGADPDFDGDLDLALTEPEPEPSAGTGPELTLADPVEPDETPSQEPDAPSLVDDGLDFGTLDLAPSPDPLVADTETASPDLLSTDGESNDGDGAMEFGGGFDFGDMDGGVELEPSFEPPQDDVGSDAMDFGGGFGGGSTDATDFSGGMELEDPMDFGSVDQGGGMASSMDLEKPMSEFTPEAPPAWMEGDQGGADLGEVMDFSAAGPAEEGAAELALRDRRTPLNKPSAPKHRRHRSLALPIVGVVGLLAVGFGGYALWPALNARFLGDSNPGEIQISLPALSPELETPMRSLASAALAASFGAVATDTNDGSVVETPSAQWLAGVYLANASQYPAVQTFWEQMEARLEGVRAIDLATFDAAFDAEATRQAVGDVDATAMRERAGSGFVAGRAEREEIFGQMEILIDAALSLHSFLLDNEANIEYVPASAGTTDPILEASPATPEIQAGMDDRIDVITRALGDLGYFDLVTADGLWAAVLALVQERGVL